MAKARKKKASKKRSYKVWSSDELKVLRRHSKERTPLKKIVRELRRSEGTVRMKAYSIGLPLGHRRRKTKKKTRL